jgi:hypothetical protein
LTSFASQSSTHPEGCADRVWPQPYKVRRQLDNISKRDSFFNKTNGEKTSIPYFLPNVETNKTENEKQDDLKIEEGY